MSIHPEARRFEFLEGLVRAAFGKFIATKRTDDASDAVHMLLNQASPKPYPLGPMPMRVLAQHHLAPVKGALPKPSPAPCAAPRRSCSRQCRRRLWWTPTTSGAN